MALRRPHLSLSLRTNLERASICTRQLHRASAATPRRPIPPLQRQTPRQTSFLHRPFTTLPPQHQLAPENPATSSNSSSQQEEPPRSKIYTYEDILSLTQSPSPNRILIDVREPSELTSTGRIPTSQNIPLQTHPDFAFLPPEEFEDRFGFPKPSAEQEVVFYCKAGVRSRAAAKMARDAGWGKERGVGEFPGSWVEWIGKGGRVER